MLLTNEFVVARPLDETWKVLTDIERIAPCMPGAQLTGVSGDEYQGKVKVKVGPMTAQFSGTAVFKEQDETAHRAVIEAKGRDASGKGRASALVTAVLVPEGTSTKVQVETDLNIAGPLAQMGRSTIADISTRLLTQFVNNLEERLAAEQSTVDAVAEAPVAAPQEAPSAAPQEAPVAALEAKPEVEAVNLTDVAGTGTLLKLALPVVVVIAAIVALVVWLV
ncbi:SRPBCC family protein [Dactylosporangium sp. NPDC051485]|uniref:SRPBCC family protein n=1 Tax=Dactylosporangium sp. NPDC051485 TaxID=3154846 RepID=UPI00342383DC